MGSRIDVVTPIDGRKGTRVAVPFLPSPENGDMAIWSRARGMPVWVSPSVFAAGTGGFLPDDPALQLAYADDYFAEDYGA